ncbi:MAG: Tol-Pal system subunit TolQ, partial [Alphaproteobacteria bacterium]|nr:Tol-Pal system subunit TolQ [Alphaproteobacteria bacterium]
MDETVVGMAVTEPEVYELSILALFWQADIVVKAVMISLIVASVWCWAVIIEKTLRISRVSRKSSRFEEHFWSGGSLDDLYDRVGQYPEDPMSAIFSAAMKEWRHASNRGLAKGGVSLQDRIERVMQVTLN